MARPASSPGPGHLAAMHQAVWPPHPFDHAVTCACGGEDAVWSGDSNGTVVRSAAADPPSLSTNEPCSSQERALQEGPADR